MARIDVGAAVGAGFGLIRRKPGVVLLWGVARVASMVAVVAVMAPVYLKMFSTMAALGPQLAASPDASQAMAAQAMGFQGPMMLMGLLAVFAGLILYCAAFRAVIRPEESRFAYLRVGAPELYLFIVFFAFEIALGVAIVIPAIVVGIAVAILTAAHATAVAVLVGVVAVLAGVAALIWVMLRFSMVGPMMVADKQFRLFESWALTRGHTGELFVIALSLIGIMLAAEVVIGIIFFAVIVAGVLAAAGGSAHLNALAGANPGALFATLAPWLVVGALLWIPLTGCFLAIVSAPWARAYLDLTRPAAGEGPSPA